MGPSPLKGTFDKPRGFALVFTTAGIEEVHKRFSCLAPFLEEITKPHIIQRSWAGLRSTQIPCNAFYLNLLMVPAGTWVRRHVDATLRRAGELEEILPSRVSVLWLRTPRELHGGELQLFAGEKQLATITAHDGELIADLNRGPVPSVVLMNPPFARSQERGKDGETAQRHLRSAIRAAAAGARIVAIMPEGFDASAFAKAQDETSLLLNVRLEQMFRRTGTGISTALAFECGEAPAQGHEPFVALDQAIGIHRGIDDRRMIAPAKHRADGRVTCRRVARMTTLDTGT